jgi:tetratricopeptide (TPR) repeat protein
MKLILLLTLTVAANAQSNNQKLGDLLQDRALYDAVARLKTDDRIAMYAALSGTKPEDAHYQNQMAATYLQKMRETMDPDYLNRAAKIVDAVLSADRVNYEALRLRSAIELERHDFPRAAGNSRELIRIAPEDPWNYGTLGDSLMELGEYSAAAAAYQKMAIDSGSRSPENVAWCLVDLGNMELKVGRIEEAGKAFQGALRLFPGYHPAHAGLGKLSAQAGQIAEAIQHYTKAQAAVPLPEYSAALEDLYEAAGKPEEARKQAARLTVIERMDQAAGFPANRNLALAYADHGRNLDHALAMIREEMKTRRDIYEHDALAWVLYQRKQYADAKEASDKALELNTPEPAFHYHAGMIALALGDRDASRKHLERALALNPKFDPKQAAQARSALAEATKEASK